MSYNKYWSMVIDNICIFILKKKKKKITFVFLPYTTVVNNVAFF